MLVYRALPSGFSNFEPNSGIKSQTNTKYSGLRTLKGLLISDVREFKNLIFVEKKVM